jgi:hypothetical protein
MFDLALLFHRLIIDINSPPTFFETKSTLFFYLHILELLKGYCLQFNVFASCGDINPNTFYHSQQFNSKQTIKTLLSFSFFWLKIIHLINALPEVYKLTRDEVEDSQLSQPGSLPSVSSPKQSKSTISSILSSPSKLFRRFSQAKSPIDHEPNSTTAPSTPQSKTIHLSSSQFNTLIWALNITIKDRTSASNRLTLTHFNHFEYFPYIPARIHNVSIALNTLIGTAISPEAAKNSTNGNGYIDVNGIPNSQLQKQFSMLLKYTLMKTSFGAVNQITDKFDKDSTAVVVGLDDIKLTTFLTLHFDHLLSLLYYYIIIQQSPTETILTVLRAVLRKANNNVVFNSQVQFGYMLCYLDILWGGLLLESLTVAESLAFITLYPTIFTPDCLPRDIVKNKDKPNVMVKDLKIDPNSILFYISSHLSYQYKSYIIPQWANLFTQAQQYLIEGQVDIIHTLVHKKTTLTSQPQRDTKSENKDGEDNNTQGEITYDENKSENIEMQRAIRQNMAINSAPSLTATVRHTPSNTIITMVYNNNVIDKYVDFYLYYIDSELSLSQKPFIQSNLGVSSGSGADGVLGDSRGNSGSNNSQTNSTNNLTKPHIQLKIALPDPTKNTTSKRGRYTTHSVTLPSIMTTNAHICIVAPQSNISSALPLLHAGFTVQVLHKLGMVSVINSETKKPVPGVYIKTFKRLNNNNNNNGNGSQNDQVEFVCDKYTDIRGKASFVDSTNSSSAGGSGNNQGQFYAIIVNHHRLGTTVVYSTGPQK